MNVLFLSHRLPYAPNRGDRVRAFHVLREISRWADVDVVSLVHDADEASHAEDLAGIAQSVTAIPVPARWNLLRAIAALPSSTPTTHSLLHASGFGQRIDRIVASRPPDVIFAYCTGIAPACFRPSLVDRPMILDMVDVDSEKWASMAKSSRLPMSWIYAREARVLRTFEAVCARKAAVTLVVNDRERMDLLALAPDAAVQVVENGVDLTTFRPVAGPAEEPSVVFCGVMNYGPNVEGAVWLAREVWPKVRARVPNARLNIVGARPTRAVHALADPASGVDVKGSVPDVRPHLWGAAVAAAPLQTARGVQNKVLEAAAAGLPVVVTPVVMEGLPAEVRSACAEAATPDTFAERIVSWLVLPPEARRAIAGRAALDALAWDRRLSGLQSLMRSVAERRSSTAPATSEKTDSGESD